MSFRIEGTAIKVHRDPEGSWFVTFQTKQGVRLDIPISAEAYDHFEELADAGDAEVKDFMFWVNVFKTIPRSHLKALGKSGGELQAFSAGWLAAFEGMIEFFKAGNSDSQQIASMLEDVMSKAWTGRDG